MANVLLGVTGSVAAMRTPDIVNALCNRRHRVRVIATRASLYFFDIDMVGPRPHFAAPDSPVVVYFDEDEWPGVGAGRRYQRDDQVLHIELRRWADVLVVAPLDANTLAKFANGLADNCLTCVWRAWDAQRPIVLAPAMNTLMWEHPLTGRQLRQLATDWSLELPGQSRDADDVVARINGAGSSLRIVPPITKQLACGDIGNGAMAEVDVLVEWVDRALSQC
jgi:phosphopantothenoylcysteine decarboxylase